MVEEDFWRSLKGLVARLNDIAHNLTWGTLNAYILESARAVKVGETLNVPRGAVGEIGLETLVDVEAPTEPRQVESRKIEWKTVGDEMGYVSQGDPHGVCELCEDYEGEYDADDPLLPFMPAHVMCRCYWGVTVKVAEP